MTIAAELLRVIRPEIAAEGVVDIDFAVAPTPLSGGFWATLHSFELRDPPVPWRGGLVLRVMPAAAAAAKEIVVQRTLAASGYHTPRVVMSGDDDGLGGAFMIMRRADGTSPLSGLKIGLDLRRLRRTLRDVPLVLARVAVELHEIDSHPVAEALAAAGIALAPLGDSAYRANVRGAAAATSASGFDELDQWFDTHEPTVDHAVVCHGDLHPFNLLVDSGGVVTVLDWTNANVCPPEFDIGFTAAFLRCAPIAAPRPVRSVMRRVAAGLADRFVAAYSAALPIRPEVLRWYEALQYARCLAEVALARIDPGGIVGPNHPFEVSAVDMRRELAAITGITVELNARTPARPR